VTIIWDELVASALRNQKGAEAPTHCDAPPDTCFTWTVDYAIEQRRVILEKTQQSLGKKFKRRRAVNFPRSVPTMTINIAGGNSDWYVDTFHRHVTTKRNFLLFASQGQD
jgi:hypothetical protein